ncbi:hypothetical protein [Vibrio diazotrophicus]|uniref:hypothetical protein n=2 Tax=Vibrio diazotrophicus TaxID=685 RepID=UPI0009DFF140
MFDMIFLDANRLEYPDYYDRLIASLRCGGLLVCDNAISHEEEFKLFTCMGGRRYKATFFHYKCR